MAYALSNTESDLQASKRARHYTGWLPQAHVQHGDPTVSYTGQGQGSQALPPAAVLVAQPGSAVYTQAAHAQSESAAATAHQAQEAENAGAFAAAKPNPLALPAASQQYPVLPQAASTAAAAAAPALQAVQGIALDKQHEVMLTSSIGLAGKLLQPADVPQQRRRAGPVNQWRPGMPLGTQQPTGHGLAAPQQHTAAVTVNTQLWPAQLQHAYAVGAGAAGASQQPLQGGAIAAALQKLLPLPGQLAVSSHTAPAGVHKANNLQQQQRPQQLQQLVSTSQHTQQILQGIPAAAATAGLRPGSLVPSAPQATGEAADAAATLPGRSSLLSRALAAGGSAAGATAGGSTAAGAASSVLGLGDLAAVGSPGWLRLLSCSVEQQGESLALELLLAGQLYKGHLTRVNAAQDAATAAAAQAAAPTSSAAAATGVPALQQQQQQQQVEEAAPDANQAAALLDFAEQREGMCFLCALPLVKEEKLPSAAGGAAVAEPGAGQPVKRDAATTGAQQAGADAQATGLPPVETLQLLPPHEQQQEQSSGVALPSEAADTLQQQQQQQQQEEEETRELHQEAAMMAQLGHTVQCDLGNGCCLMMHQACAEWSAKAAALQQPQFWQVQEMPSMGQLLACLPCQCCGCDQKAATLQCAATGCSRMFHVPCVEAMGAVLLQDGTCWCSEHLSQQQEQQQAGAAGSTLITTQQQPYLQSAGGTAGTSGAADGLSSPEPSKAGATINPSPSFAAALVLQQMRCSKGYDVLLVGPESEQAGVNAPSSSSGAGSSSLAAGRAATRLPSSHTRSSAQRRLLEAMPTGHNSSSSMLAAGPCEYAGAGGGHRSMQPAGLYGSTAEANRQYHLELQQQGAYGLMGPAASGPGPATTLLLQRLQQQSEQSAWQLEQQQQAVGPMRRSPRAAKGRPPLQAPAGKAKGGWNTLGLISAFALAQQQQPEVQQEQLAASHAAAAAVAVSGPTVVVPRVRARKGAVAHHVAQY